MIGLGMFTGSAVRTIYGDKGRIVGIGTTGVKIAWEGKAPREYGSRDEEFLRGIEILTLNSGWAPMVAVLGESEGRPRGRLDLVEDLQKILNERSAHWPFKNQDTLNPGPNVEFGQRSVDRKDDWKCSCSNYVCSCKGVGSDVSGRRKKVRIKKGYKNRYNKLYKKWRAAQERKAKKK